MLKSKDRHIQKFPTSPLSAESLSLNIKTGSSRHKSSFQELFSIESQESKDLACLVIHSLKSKTQVSSPKFLSLLNNGLHSEEPAEFDSFQFELYKKCSEEKIRKLEQDLEVKSRKLSLFELKSSQKFQNMTIKPFGAKLERISELLEKLKQDKLALTELVLKTCSIKELLQKNFLELFKNNESLSFNRKLSGSQGKITERRSLSLNFSDKKTSFVFFNAQTSKLEEQIMNSLKDMQNFYKAKMKNEHAKHLQILAQLKLELLHKEEEIAKFNKNLENSEGKVKRLEKQNMQLNLEIDELCKENSKIMQDFLKLVKKQENVEKNQNIYSDLQSKLKKEKKNEGELEELQESLKNLEDQNTELQRMIKKITKNSGFTELQHENSELKTQINDLREKCTLKEKELSSYSLKIFQLENNIKTLNEIVSKCKEKHFKLNSELKQLKDQEKKRSILYIKSEKLSNLENFPVDLNNFKTLLPKFDSLSKYLESILIFRQNLMKTFTFPDELLVFREVPIKFLEKSLYYFEVLKKVTKYFMCKKELKDLNIDYIKELELLVYQLKEQNQEDRLRIQSFYIDQESLLLNEIEALQTSLNYSKARLRTLKPCKSSSSPSKLFQSIETSKSKDQESLTDLTNQSTPGKSSLKTEKSTSLNETPLKPESFPHLESRIAELSLSASQYKAKSKRLKREKNDLIEELKDLQFKDKNN